MASIAVVGGGLAGLAAAYRLRRRGHDVVVYEAEERAGGAVRTEREGGFLAELGATSMAVPADDVETLFAELGLAERRLPAAPAARHRYVMRGGRPVALPRRPADLLRSPLLSLRGRLRLLGEAFVRPARADAEETVSGFARRRFGAEAADYLADPLVTGIYAGDPDRLALRYALPRVAALEQRHGSLLRAMAVAGRSGAARRIVAPRDGMEEIARALAAALGDAVTLGRRVTAVRPVGQRWSVRWDSGAAGESAHDAVVLAGPAHATAQLSLGGALAPLIALGAIAHPPVSTLALGFRRDQVAHPLDGFGVLVPSAERMTLLGVVFASTVFPDRAPADHVLLGVLVGGTRAPANAELGLPAVTDRVLRELRSSLGVLGDPVFLRHARWPRAIPQPELGYGRFLATADAVEAAAPGVALAGSWRHGVAVGDALRSGLVAAARLATTLE